MRAMSFIAPFNLVKSHVATTPDENATEHAATPALLSSQVQPTTGIQDNLTASPVLRFG